MPEIGDIKYGCEFGHNHKSSKFMWAACLDCGKERWVLIKNLKDIPHLKSERCLRCSHRVNPPRGDKNIHWQGGIYHHGCGYILLRVQPDDFFYPMHTDGYIMEHRLVMAKHIGRCLQKWEVVHHINSIRNDNRLQNLKLFDSNVEHMKEHRLLRVF